MEGKDCKFTIAIGILFFLTLPLASAQINLPSATILSVNYPSHATPGQTFSVTIVTAYSAKSGVDVGIWDVREGVVVQSFSIPLPRPGNATFDFKLTAPPSEGDWQLVAITRIWWQDAWFLDPNGGSRKFTVNVSDNANLAVTSEGAGSTISIDGANHTLTANQPQAVLVKHGFHVLGAQSVIQTEPRERFVFVEWSDGVNSNPRKILVNRDTTIAAIYRTEYYLSVKSRIGQTSGEGWYEKGEKASFAAAPTFTEESWFGLLTEEHHFAGWLGDSTSNDPVDALTMDQPKTVEATWSTSRTRTLNPVLVSTLFYLGAFGLASRILYRQLRTLRPKTRKLTRATMRWIRVLVPLAAFLMASALVPPVYSQLPGQSTRSIVTIGDASWYYWRQGASDTCILWLGGGVAKELGGGYDQYWINPFEYESFGTLRFLQDISKYYCVLALEKGSYKSLDVAANRTIFQEPYQIQSQIIDQVHRWIIGQGYAHTYLVGYSVGAQVAATVVSMQSPTDWTSPDGLILITPYLFTDQIQNAPRTRASVLVIYGGSIETPQYIATGKAFYNATRREGWYGTYYLHKEYHVIPKMGHEVWTVFENGAYDAQALHILVNFVEKSKALQIRPNEVARIISEANNNSVQDIGVNITNVRASATTTPDEILVLNADVSQRSQTKTLLRIIAFDTRSRQIETVTELSSIRGREYAVNLLVSPPFQSSNLSLGIVVLHEEHGDWLVSTRPWFTSTRVLNTATVTLETTVPNAPLVLDNTAYQVAGSLDLEVIPGIHTIQATPLIQLGSQTRAVFTEWEDGTSYPIRQVDLRGNSTIVAIYRKQHFVTVTSPYGQVTGSGWYDENSTATILLQPPMIQENGVLFLQWEDGSTDNHPRTLFFITSPERIQAVWAMISSTNSNLSGNLLQILPSVVIFLVLLTLNMRRTKSQSPSQAKQ